MAMNRADVAWAAGLFEGEGCLGLVKGRSPLAQISMTDRDVMERFDDIVMLGKGRGIHGTYALPSGKMRYTLGYGGYEQVQHIVAMFWPWLGQRRRERAAEALAAASRSTKYRRRNRHGNPPPQA